MQQDRDLQRVTVWLSFPTGLNGLLLPVEGRATWKINVAM